MILVSIVDFPSLITITGSIWIRSTIKIILIAIAAAIIGFATSRTHTDLVLCYKLISQLIVAFCIIRIRKIESKRMRISVASISIFLMLCAAALISYLAVKQGQKYVAQAKVHIAKSNSQANSDKLDYTTREIVEYKNTSSDGHEYLRTCDSSGYVLKSKYPISRFSGDIAYTKPISAYETIAISKECNAFSQSLGTGKWCWANGGFVIEFPKVRIGFPRGELYCKEFDSFEHQCRCE